MDLLLRSRSTLVFALPVVQHPGAYAPAHELSDAGLDPYLLEVGAVVASFRVVPKVLGDFVELAPDFPHDPRGGPDLRLPAFL